MIRRLVCLANNMRIFDFYVKTKRLIAPQIAILCYHLISPNADKKYLARVIPPETFRLQIDELARSFELLSLEDIALRLQKRKNLPNKAIVITIDDGYKDNYRYAYPVLQRLKAPATMFVATGAIGKDNLFWFNNVKYICQYTRLEELKSVEYGRFLFKSETDRAKSIRRLTQYLKTVPENKRSYIVQQLSSDLDVNIPDALQTQDILTWDNIREMHSGGISFGAHTINHPVLTRIPLQQAKDEIIGSKKDIEQKLNTSVLSFAYPHGGFRDFSDNIVSILKQSGFLCAVTTIPRWVNLAEDPFKLGRIVVPDDPDRYKALFSGLYGDLKLYRFIP